jgi:hypothetical protein
MSACMRLSHHSAKRNSGGLSDGEVTDLDLLRMHYEYRALQAILRLTARCLQGAEQRVIKAIAMGLDSFGRQRRQLYHSKSGTSTEVAPPSTRRYTSTG